MVSKIKNEFINLIFPDYNKTKMSSDCFLSKIQVRTNPGQDKVRSGQLQVKTKFKPHEFVLSGRSRYIQVNINPGQDKIRSRQNKVKPTASQYKFCNIGGGGGRRSRNASNCSSR